MNNHEISKILFYKAKSYFENNDVFRCKISAYIIEVENSFFSESYFPSFVKMLISYPQIFEYFFKNEFFVKDIEAISKFEAISFKHSVIESYVSYCFKEVSLKPLDFFCNLYLEINNKLNINDKDYTSSLTVLLQLRKLHKSKHHRLIFFLNEVNVMRLFHKNHARMLQNIIATNPKLKTTFDRMTDLNKIKSIQLKAENF